MLQRLLFEDTMKYSPIDIYRLAWMIKFLDKAGGSDDERARRQEYRLQTLMMNETTPEEMLSMDELSKWGLNTLQDVDARMVRWP